MNQQWYYSTGGSQVGPISESELQQLVTNQTIQKQTFVWADGMADWAAAETAFPQLFIAASPTPIIATPTAVAPVVATTPSPYFDSSPATNGLTNAEPATPSPETKSELDVSDAYRATSSSQPTLSSDVYTMTPVQVLFSFQGRIRRSTYWGYTLVVIAIFVAIIIAPMYIFGEESEITAIIMLVVYIPLVWINIAISVKRWHDRGKSGWWYLVTLIPYIGGIWALVENGCLEGDYGTNFYGPDPKGRTATQYTRIN